MGGPVGFAEVLRRLGVGVRIRVTGWTQGWRGSSLSLERQGKMTVGSRVRGGWMAALGLSARRWGGVLDSKEGSRIAGDDGTG